MKWKIALIIFCAMLAIISVNSQAVGINNLKDGGLNGTYNLIVYPNNSGTLNGWNYSIQNYTGIAWSESAYNPQHISEGSSALRTCGYNGMPSTSSVYITFWQDIPVLSDSFYQISTKVLNYQAVAGKWNSNNYARTLVQELDANKNWVSTAADVYKTGYDNTNWKTYYGAWKVSSKTCFVRFYFQTYIYGADGTQCYCIWDDCNLSPITTTTNWSQYRGNPRLTGRAALKGAITSPSTKWSKDISARETLLSGQFGGGNGSASLPTSDSGDYSAVETDWGTANGRYMDLNGNSTFESDEWVVNSSHCIIGNFTASPGLEKIETDSAWVTSPQYVKLYHRSGNSWVLDWTSSAVSGMYMGLPIVDDFDNDGALEVACLGQGPSATGDMAVFRISDGSRKNSIQTFIPSGTESGRAYGWFGAVDVNNDNKKEFIILSSAENYISVVGWNGNNTTLMWNKLIEAGVSAPVTVQRAPTNPVQDVDGDGYKEIVTSFYNYNPTNGTHDGKWHIAIYNGRNNTLRRDIPDAYCSGLVDIDGDGVYEILATQTSGRIILENGTVYAYSFMGGNLSTMWSLNGEHYQMQNAYNILPLSVHTGAPTGPLTLLANPIVSGGRNVFVTRVLTDAQAGTVRLSFWQYNGSNVVCIGRYIGPNMEAKAIHAASSPNPCVLMRTSVPLNASVTYTYLDGAAQATVQASRSHSTIDPSPVVVTKLNAGDTYAAVIVEEANERTIAFQATSSANTLWEKPGRGLFNGSILVGTNYRCGGLMTGDIDAVASHFETIAATKATDGSSRLVAYNTDGSEKWHHDFIDIMGGAPLWGTSGITVWFTGWFTTTSHKDVMVSVRTNTSNETYLLDGTDGDVIWHLSAGPEGRGTCGGWMAIYDHDGDGLDDALAMYPDIAYVIKGTNGSILLEKTSVNLFGSACLQATPVVDSYLSDGSRAMLWGSNQYILSIVKMDLSTYQWKLTESTPKMPWLPEVLADINGDGYLELLQPGYYPTVYGYNNHTMYVRNPSTGANIYTWTGWTGTYGEGPVVCDIDNDGKDEMLVVWDNKLRCAGTNANGNYVIKWDWTNTSNLGTPAIYDVDNDGYAEIVISDKNGYIHCIDQTP